MIDTGTPHTRDELITALLDVHRQSVDVVTAIPDDEFVTPQTAAGRPAWSPAGHVRHLAKSVRPIARLMKRPEVVRKKFGAAEVSTRGFDGVRRLYAAALESGPDAGPFGPSTPDRTTDIAAWRLEKMNDWTAAVDELIAALRSWADGDLDTHQIPHPLVGPLTVRDMVAFTVYHNAHHIQRVVERGG